MSGCSGRRRVFVGARGGVKDLRRLGGERGSGEEGAQRLEPLELRQRRRRRLAFVQARRPLAEGLAIWSRHGSTFTSQCPEIADRGDGERKVPCVDGTIDRELEAFDGRLAAPICCRSRPVMTSALGIEGSRSTTAALHRSEASVSSASSSASARSMGELVGWVPGESGGGLACEGGEITGGDPEPFGPALAAEGSSAAADTLSRSGGQRPQAPRGRAAAIRGRRRLAVVQRRSAAAGASRSCSGDPRPQAPRGRAAAVSGRRRLAVVQRRSAAAGASRSCSGGQRPQAPRGRAAAVSGRRPLGTVCFSKRFALHLPGLARAVIGALPPRREHYCPSRTYRTAACTWASVHR